MNRFRAALSVLMRKDAGKVLSLTKPDDWNVGDPDTPDRPEASSVLSISAAWACVNLLAGTQASLPLMVYRTASNGSRTVARDHPLFRVLHDSPNSLQTAQDFWEFIAGSLELWGSGYARKVRSAGQIVGLIPIMPQLPQVTRQANGVLRYRWSEDGSSYDLTNDDVLHIRGFGGNPLGGMSTLAFGARTFGIAISAERAAGNTFKNGMRPSGVLRVKDSLSADQRRETEELLREKFVGAMNAGRPMLLDRDTDWKSLTINPEDAQMLETRQFSVEDVCRFFGVPPHMVGHTQNSTSWGTGLEQQTLGFQKFTLRRRLNRIEQALEKQLLSPADRANGVTIEFNVEGLLRGDSKARAEFYTAALGDTQKPGWMVRNEVRKLENLEPIPGWDEPIQLLQQSEPTSTPALPRKQEGGGDMVLASDLRVKRDEPTYETKDFAFQVKSVNDTGVFEGYGSVYGVVDSYGEKVMPGAFMDSLARHKRDGTSPLMLWQHDSYQPIGVWEDLAEDGKGLRAKGRLLQGVRAADEALILMKAKAIQGLSIGYRELDVEPDGNVRLLKKLDLMEISVVSFPANRRARVEGIKSERMQEFARRLRDGDPMPIKEFEDILREAGVPKSMAVQIASVGYAKAIRSESEGMNDRSTAFLSDLLRRGHSINS